MRRRKKILLGLLALFLLALGAAAALITSMQSMISERLAKGWTLPPMELYSQGFALSPGRHLDASALLAELQHRSLEVGRDYQMDTPDLCAHGSAVTPQQSGAHCLWLKEPAVLVTWDDQGWILELWSGQPLQPADHLALFPRLITQFYDGQPILQQNTPLSEIPLVCLQAVTAIEDKEFLEHKGVSATGTLRAVARNLRKRRWAEGGSTITQQLVKNFFLTPKKTLRRKVEEQILAILLESQINKDQILEMYLNVIYMGQAGPYQVRGIGSASHHYFDKPVSQLNLSECAMLAALINSPGRYSPFDNKARAQQRRELVLRKMNEAGMIDGTEMASANERDLPQLPAQQKRVYAPYYVMSALREFQSWQIESENGARLYTALDPDAQSAIVEAAAQTLPVIEKRIRKPSKQPLQIAVLTVDLLEARVIGVLGGRDFRTTQFNRASDSRRQIGSVVKPFVYLPAVKDNSPLTMVVDEPFEWKAGNQVWKPKNYEKGFHGPVPYFYALAESLNIPAAKVGQAVGLEAIEEAIKSSGIRAEVPLLPSLTLGAFELSLMDLAQGYSTLARMGEGENLHTLERVEDINGNVVFSREPARDLKLDPSATAILIGMLQQSLELGTARAARSWGLEGPYAGKTGTTSDTKDAWFAGFNGRLLTVVWIGYDDNTVMGLTGASAALPVWVSIAKRLEAFYKPDDFAWPSGVEKRQIPRDKLLEDFPDLKNLPEEVELVFKDWAS